MTHTYGSHVLRTFLEALGGVHVKDEVVRSRASRGQRRDNENKTQCQKIMSKTFTTAFLPSFKVISEKLIRLCNFEDHLADQNFCPVLQTLMLILHKTEPHKYQDLVNTITEKARLFHHNEDAGVDDVSNRLPDIVQNEVGSYLVELLLSLATETQFQELYYNMFKKRIIYFAVHPIANYVLQKMLSCVGQSKMMEEMLTDIKPYLEDILAVNHIGIVTKLASACRRTETGQEEFLQALMGAFHCADPEDRQKKIVPLLASLQTYEVFYTSSEKDSEETSEEKNVSPAPLLKDVNIHGSLMLQELLQFKRTQIVASSLVSLSPPEVVSLCCDRCGSHLMDMFFTSRTVLEKNKVVMLKKLQGSFINIACNRNGSRCLENIWKTCALKQKIHIAEDLSKSQERLEGDQWGRFLYRNFALGKFSQRRKEWVDVQTASSKKKQLIKDILEGKASSRKKKRNKNEEMEILPQVTSQDTSELHANEKRKSAELVQQRTDGRATEALSDKEIHIHTLADEESTSQAKGHSKKRKRKKEKKRVVRENDNIETKNLKDEIEDEIKKTVDTDEESTEQKGNKSTKMKKKQKVFTDLEESQTVESSKSKHNCDETVKKKKKKKKE
ncbi:hypothetical protein EGW08_018802 [Elysia chlorotica]|uniref:Nucleolar protein 9 n=1 Tax=Elysia chlorotica TaxID=188477 RepID=A0A3S1BRW4_ELYCH|nr:hypothetical protein EGW08_018802 [Elysia chlorotica]